MAEDFPPPASLVSDGESVSGVTGIIPACFFFDEVLAAGLPDSLVGVAGDFPPPGSLVSDGESVSGVFLLRGLAFSCGIIAACIFFCEVLAAGLPDSFVGEGESVSGVTGLISAGEVLAGGFKLLGFASPILAGGCSSPLSTGECHTPPSLSSSLMDCAGSAFG